jgi:hypothetical protein
MGMTPSQFHQLPILKTYFSEILTINFLSIYTFLVTSSYLAKVFEQYWSSLGHLAYLLSPL